MPSKIAGSDSALVSRKCCVLIVKPQVLITERWRSFKASELVLQVCVGRYV
jgi:hypothetical protein